MASNSTTPNSNTIPYRIRFHYQSHDIRFPEWITLMTLCLAPLLAHLIAGVPTPVYLHNSRPKWHEQIVHYNPTSILWRYFSITDRRIRARNWNAMDMAAGNALFWTARGWDGSEDIMVKSRAICVRAPASTRGRLFSADTVKTLIVGLQGIQAIIILTPRPTLKNLDNDSYSADALDAIFMPLAIMGLLRLAAALWLTDEQLFISTIHDNGSELVNSEISTIPQTGPDGSAITLLPVSNKPQLVPSTISIQTSQSLDVPNFHSATSIRGLAVRFFYTIYLLFGIFIVVMQMLTVYRGGTPASTFVMIYFYGILIVVAAGTHIFYYVFRRSAASSTVLPCITTRWYKVYTCFLGVAMVVLVVLSALETRRTPCGLYTTIEAAYDRYACPGLVFADKVAV